MLFVQLITMQLNLITRDTITQMLSIDNTSRGISSGLWFSVICTKVHLHDNSDRFTCSIFYIFALTRKSIFQIEKGMVSKNNDYNFIIIGHR